MGWSIGFDERWQRDIGYGVPSICDHPECKVKIDRGLAYVCGGDPYGGEHGCGLFFCASHLFFAGDKRQNVQICSRCYHGQGKYYTPKPDLYEWISHKLKDPSWKAWRKENPETVKRYRGMTFIAVPTSEQP